MKPGRQEKEKKKWRGSLLNCGSHLPFTVQSGWHSEQAFSRLVSWRRKIDLTWKHRSKRERSGSAPNDWWSPQPPAFGLLTARGFGRDKLRGLSASRSMRNAGGASWLFRGIDTTRHSTATMGSRNYGQKLQQQPLTQ